MPAATARRVDKKECSMPTASERRQYVFALMVNASIRRNALASIARGADIPYDDKAFLSELDDKIDEQTQIIAECYQALKGIDTAQE